MKLKILSFWGETFSSETVESITMMTLAWEITVLENHTALLTSVKPSTMYIVYKDENNISKRDDFAIWTWIVEVSNNSVKIMADMLIDIENLDKDEAERAREEAMKLMEKYKNSKDKVDMEKFIEAEDLLLKSITQLKLWNIK